MKDKNLPNDYNSLTLEELTKEANKMIEDLESEKDLENSLENYQNLLKLNKYEIINDSYSSYGAEVFLNFNDNNASRSWSEKFSLNPFYRFYFFNLIQF